MFNPSVKKLEAGSWKLEVGSWKNYFSLLKLFHYHQPSDNKVAD